jgi:DNA-binding NarL/FixJ family response regulator
MEQLETDVSPGLRIVLIDHHAEVRSGLARSLRTDRRVAGLADAADVEQARPLIDAGSQQVVLIDPGKWEGTGRNSLRTLIQLRDRSAWFLIALHVTHAEDRHLAEAREMGADAHLLKGLRTGDLVTALLYQLGTHGRASRESPV